MGYSANGHCHCEVTKLTIRGNPIIRGFCHCTICQAFNQAPYADITLFHARDIHCPGNNPVAFEVHRSPPLLQRGRCTACGHPAIEFLRLPLMPKLAIIPSANISNPALVPEPSLHIFYGTRVADVDDGLPKYTGYAHSQLAFGSRAIAAMLPSITHPTGTNQ